MSYMTVTNCDYDDQVISKQPAVDVGLAAQSHVGKALMTELVRLAIVCANDDTPYARFVSMVEKMAAGKKP